MMNSGIAGPNSPGKRARPRTLARNRFYQATRFPSSPGKSSRSCVRRVTELGPNNPSRRINRNVAMSCAAPWRRFFPTGHCGAFWGVAWRAVERIFPKRESLGNFGKSQLLSKCQRAHRVGWASPTVRMQGGRCPPTANEGAARRSALARNIFELNRRGAVGSTKKFLSGGAFSIFGALRPRPTYG